MNKAEAQASRTRADICFFADDRTAVADLRSDNRIKHRLFAWMMICRLQSF